MIWAEGFGCRYTQFVCVVSAQMGEDVNGCICTALRQATRSVTRFYDEALAPTGLVTTQYALLSQVREHGPIGVSELADVIVMDRTTLSRNLQPLVAQDLVHLRSTTDRRRRQITLTPRGERAYQRAYPLWVEAQRQFAERFGDDATEALRELTRLTVERFR